jgi:hypothetical protein
MLRFLDHTQLDKQPEGLLWTSDQLVAEAATYTTRNKRKRRTSMPSAGLESAIPGSEMQQTYVLDLTVTANGHFNFV